jgi:hypothetical protein
MSTAVRAAGGVGRRGSSGSGAYGGVMNSSRVDDCPEVTV